MGMLRSIFRPFLWVGDLIEIVKSVEPFFLRKPKKVGKTWELRCMFLKKHVFFPWNITQADWRWFNLVHLFFFQEWFVNPMRLFFCKCGPTRPVKTGVFFGHVFGFPSVEDDLEKTTGKWSGVYLVVWNYPNKVHSQWLAAKLTQVWIPNNEQRFCWGSTWVFSVGKWLQERTKHFGIAEFVWNQVLLTDFCGTWQFCDRDLFGYRWKIPDRPFGKWCDIPWPPSRKKGDEVKGHRIESITFPRTFKGVGCLTWFRYSYGVSSFTIP